MDLTFVPRKRSGARRKYDWDALIDPGEFFVSAASHDEAETLRVRILSAHNNNARLSGKISTKAGEFAWPDGTRKFGVWVRRRS